MQTKVTKNRIKITGQDILKDVQRIHAAAAQVIASIQTQLVPVDTGDLQSTIRIEQINENVIAVREGTDQIDYALYVEYGTDNNISQPHIRPAAEMGKRHIVNELAKMKAKYR